MRMDQASNEYSMYIPRVALSSSSSSSKGSSRLTEFKTARRNGEVSETSGESESEGIYGSSIRNYTPRAGRDRMYFVHKAPKRGSNSTKSSSASSSSNHSNYSVNSLLLSVKNLENFNKSVEQAQSKSSSSDRHIADDNPNIILKPNFYDNYVVNYDTHNYPIYEYRSKMLENIRNIAANNDKLMSSASITQEKEADAISITSSRTNTNFTVVSLNDRRLNKSKAFCRRSRQITILILVMTFLFLILISFMLLALDMRNQKMPR